MTRLDRDGRLVKTEKMGLTLTLLNELRRQKVLTANDKFGR